mgnify:FL=1
MEGSETYRGPSAGSEPETQTMLGMEWGIGVEKGVKGKEGKRVIFVHFVAFLVVFSAF